MRLILMCTNIVVEIYVLVAMENIKQEKKKDTWNRQYYNLQLIFQLTMY